MTVYRLAFLVLAVAATSSAERLNPWSFVAPESSMVIAMEWRKVLDSEYREAVRREVPPSVSPYLNGINFIEGIDRVMVALQGKSP
ncbi:MAG TPA: hypothetical protein VMZ52_03810, partial [Bryobacteraceae bacterium]|nr:hypothetical protein [Bryobacteraceae bacterium]